MSPSTNWSVALAIENMDQAGIATTMLSITAPGDLRAIVRGNALALLPRLRA